MVLTDYQALRSLLNTPWLSGKLARWGMALQELELTIQHRSGKHNGNADALLRFPLTLMGNSDLNAPDGVIANLTNSGDDLPAMQT